MVPRTCAATEWKPSPISCAASTLLKYCLPSIHTALTSCHSSLVIHRSLLISFILGNLCKTQIWPCHNHRSKSFSGSHRIKFSKSFILWPFLHLKPLLHSPITYILSLWPWHSSLWQLCSYLPSQHSYSQGHLLSFLLNPSICVSK